MALESFFAPLYPAADLVDRRVLELSAVLLQKPFGKTELSRRLAALLPPRSGSKLLGAGRI